MVDLKTVLGTEGVDLATETTDLVLTQACDPEDLLQTHYVLS